MASDLFCLGPMNDDEVESLLLGSTNEGMALDLFCLGPMDDGEVRPLLTRDEAESDLFC